MSSPQGAPLLNPLLRIPRPLLLPHIENLPLDVNKLNQKTTQLQEQNAALASQVSAAAASLRIEAAARKLGLVPALSTDTSYVNLGAAK